MDILKDYPVIYNQIVAWGDMDAFGHLNNVMYYRYIESARICYFESLDLFHQNVMTVVSQSSCRYLSSVLFPDTLLIGTRVDEIRQSAMRMSYILYSKQQDKVVAQGEAIMVCLDPKTQQKMAIPDVLKTKILALEAQVNHQL